MRAYPEDLRKKIAEVVEQGMKRARRPAPLGGLSSLKRYVYWPVRNRSTIALSRSNNHACRKLLAVAWQPLPYLKQHKRVSHQNSPAYS
jgi:hypothetical protein